MTEIHRKKNGKPRNITPARAKRIARVITLYDMDMSFGQIAEHIGASKSTVYKDYQYGIRDIYQPKAEERIGKIERQYQQLRRQWWHKAMDGDPKAANIILKALQDERRLLGVDRPQRHELTVDAEATNLAEQISETVADMIELGLDASGLDELG